MLVDVVRLRADGVKLSPESLRTAAVTRGHLHFSSWIRGGNVGGWEPGRVFEATLKTAIGGPGGNSLIPDLTEARVKKIEGDNIIVVGAELVGGFTTSHARAQAWWCRLVYPSA